MNVQPAPDAQQALHAPIAAQIARARAAMATLKGASQERIDEAVTALAWAVYKPQADDYVTRALDPTAAPSYGVPGDE